MKANFEANDQSVIILTPYFKILSPRSEFSRYHLFIYLFSRMITWNQYQLTRLKKYILLNIASSSVLMRDNQI